MDQAEGRRRLSQMIADAHRVVVFTGAGISTESGIPDFRSPGGVWSTMKPIYFQDFVASEEARREAWNRTFNRTAGWTGASPNAGHAAVARLVASGKGSAVITQNVDNLHQESGVPADQVIELHGNASHAKCLTCQALYDFDPFEAPFRERDEIPTCPACGGLLKSATISFGQSMPREPLARATAETLACDLFLVLGSSLVVVPAADLPIMAKHNGARLVIVNREPTDMDRLADLVLHDEIGPVMTAAVPQE
jgi:NAD-dependent deacetylase